MDEFENLGRALAKMLGKRITGATSNAQPLRGGTLGDVRLVSGLATTTGGGCLPYMLVLKRRKRWERPADPGSWRREHDLYQSDLENAFGPELCWPKCYYSEIRDGVMELWLEHIDGVSGGSLGIDALELAALEWGRFQGRVAKEHTGLEDIVGLGDSGFVQRDFVHRYTKTHPRDLLVSEQCHIPGHIKDMLKTGAIRLLDGRSLEHSWLCSEGCDLPEHTKAMLIGIGDRKDELFSRLESLPTVLCHRDFWDENIFCFGGGIRVIDWDTAGWGFFGEDIASLIADGMDVGRFEENYRRLVPACVEGISEYMDAPDNAGTHILDMMLIRFGYRMAQQCMFTKPGGPKSWGWYALQKICEMRDAESNA